MGCLSRLGEFLPLGLYGFDALIEMVKYWYVQAEIKDAERLRRLLRGIGKMYMEVFRDGAEGRREVQLAQVLRFVW